MKFRKFGRIGLALAVSLGTGLGVTSCSTNHTVGYFYVTGSQYNQISAFKIDNNLGNLTPIPNSPFASGGVNPIKALVANAGKISLCSERRLRRNLADCLPAEHACERNWSQHRAVHHRRPRRSEFPGDLYQPGQCNQFPSRRILPALIYSSSIRPSRTHL